MIIESRKWRVILPGLALLAATILILAVAGPASYALQDNTPRPIYGPGTLPGQLDGRFAVLQAQADLARAVALHRDGHTSYWVPVRGYTAPDGAITLYVLTDDVHGTAAAAGGWPAAATATGNPPAFVGRLVRFDAAPYAADAEKVLAAALNTPQAPEAYVLIVGEAPDTFRPMVPLAGALGVIWFLSLVAVIRAGRRAPHRRRWGFL